MRPDAVDWDEKQGVSLAFLPRQRLQRTLWQWVVLITFVQVVVAAGVLVALQGPWRQVMRPDQTQSVGAMAAGLFEGHTFEEDGDRTVRLLRQVVAGDAVGFAGVMDAEGRLLATVAAADSAWADAAAPEPGGRAAPEAVDGPTVVATDPLAGTLTMHVPVGGQGHQLMLGMHDLSTRRALLDGAVAIAAGLLVVGLTVLPIACFRLRRWTTGMKQLHTAIRSLAQGAEPKPLPVGGEDEIAYLSIAFNDMASQLLASRRELLNVNKSLERRVAERTEELREAAMKLEQLATSDMLTGLPNRRALAQELQSMFDASVRTDGDLVCLAIDLDGFKTINDRLGHASGDELLKLASDVFRSLCRSSDLAARLGGDEFVLLVPARDPNATIPLAERLLEQFHDRCAERFRDEAVPVLPSMSIGIASRKQTAVKSAERLLQAADKALYRAKGAGKNCYRMWEPEEEAAAS